MTLRPLESVNPAASGQSPVERYVVSHLRHQSDKDGERNEKSGNTQGVTHPFMGPGFHMVLDYSSFLTSLTDCQAGHRRDQDSIKHAMTQSGFSHVSHC